MALDNSILYMMYFEIRLEKGPLVTGFNIMPKTFTSSPVEGGGFPKHFYNNMLAVLLYKRLTNFFHRYLAQLRHVLFGIRKRHILSSGCAVRREFCNSLIIQTFLRRAKPGPRYVFLS